MSKKKSKKHSAPARKSGKPCGCGCGRSASPGSTYLPGHDAKLHSKLAAQARCGNKQAAAALRKHGWSVPKAV